MKMHNKTNTRKRRWLIWAAAIIILFIFVRFAVFFAVSEGFSGIAIAVPLFLMGGILFWLFMSVFFGAWVYQDCRKRGGMILCSGSLLFFSHPL